MTFISTYIQMFKPLTLADMFKFVDVSSSLGLALYHFYFI